MTQDCVPQLARPSALLAPVSRAYLFTEGEEAGGPEGPGYLAAIEAITSVASALQRGLEHCGRAREAVGRLEKIHLLRHSGDPCWHWQLLVEVPSSVTHSVVELAKHLAGKPEVELLRVEPPPRVRKSRGRRRSLARRAAIRTGSTG